MTLLLRVGVRLSPASRATSRLLSQKPVPSPQSLQSSSSCARRSWCKIQQVIRQRIRCVFLCVKCTVGLNHNGVYRTDGDFCIP